MDAGPGPSPGTPLPEIKTEPGTEAENDLRGDGVGIELEIEFYHSEVKQEGLEAAGQTQPSSDLYKMKQARSSETWKYFKVISERNRIASCCICKQKLLATVASLEKHLQAKHPATSRLPSAAWPSRTSDIPSTSSYRNVVQESKPSGGSQPAAWTAAPGAAQQEEPPELLSQPSQSSPPRYSPKEMTPAFSKEIDEALMSLFSKDFQPFSIVEDRGFRKFVNVLNPAYELPTRKHISKTMLTLTNNTCYTINKNRLETDLTSVCLTTDCWTSAARDSYIAVTAHYIDEDFKFNSVLLECSCLPASHTTLIIAEELRRVVREWEMSEKVLIVISDDALDMQNAIRDLNYKHFGCFAHTVNSVAREALGVEGITDVLGKVRTIAKHFKRSTLSTEQLRIYQVDSGKMNPKALVKDDVTRWNSTYYMLERFLLLQDAIQSTSDRNIPILTTDEWKVCRDLCKVLKPLQEVTNDISKEKYMTGSQVIVFNTTLLNMYQKTIPAKSDALDCSVMKVVKVIESGLVNRLANIEYSETFSICTLLDPRYKTFFFMESKAADEAIRKLIELVMLEMNKNLPIPQTAEPVAKNEEDDFSIWTNINSKMSTIQQAVSAERNARAEVQRYLDGAMLPRDENAYEWWKHHRFVYPALSNVYRKYGCVLATSVPCERIFSKSGRTISDRRATLGSRKVSQLMFLHVDEKTHNSPREIRH